MDNCPKCGQMPETYTLIHDFSQNDEESIGRYLTACSNIKCDRKTGFYESRSEAEQAWRSIHGSSKLEISLRRP